METHPERGKRPCDDGGRDVGDVPAGQEHGGLPATLRGRKMGGGSSPRPAFQTSGLQDCERDISVILRRAVW